MARNRVMLYFNRINVTHILFLNERMELLTRTVPVNKLLLAGTVPVNKL